MPLPRLPGPDELCLHAHTAAGQIGPLSRRTLASKVASKEVAPDDHFWFEGLSDWLPVSAHPELVEALGEPASTAGPARAGESDDEHQERVFGSLVKESWNYLTEHAFAESVDEMLVGAVITSTLDAGFSLIDLSSDGQHHHLRFENFGDKERPRIIFRLTHLTPSLAMAKVLGQRASVIVGYGERVANAAAVVNAMKAEWKSGFIQNAEPGTVTVDGDLGTGYVYCQVDLYWKLDDYIKPDFSVEYPLLTSHVRAITHSLRKYLRGRFK
ncbi:MAG: DUF4339 domain-containing protein [Deltaproteobacteria bacterium]|nr:DUF4339 domain-containing protein [Deltaproteobacteria bacterium]